MFHKDLDVWKNSIELVKSIYIITKTFPKEELYGLTSQIRRCAVSIPSNISEGAARSSSKDYIRFLYIAAGSLAELDTQLIISKELNYISKEKFDELEVSLDSIAKMLQGVIRYQRNKSGNGE
ncbi:MAG: four helix bundle protein [Candidatus Cloacimonetes bacterium]|nr:four helix bundle protein [Candidatus Cloacimonadota bacterium]